MSNSTAIGIGTTAPAYTLDVSAASTAPLRVGVGSTNALVVNSSGNVGIGTTGPGATLDVSGSIRSSNLITTNYLSVPTQMYIGSNNTNSFNFISYGYNNYCYMGGNYTNSIDFPNLYLNAPDTANRYVLTFGTNSIANGATTVTAGTNYGSIKTFSGSTQYNTTSDYRLKENVIDLSNCLFVITNLKPRQFNFIECPGYIHNGFIAHEVQEYVPQAVSHKKDEVDASGNMVIQQLDASKIIPHLVGAIQEQNVVVQELQSENAELKAKFAALEARLAVAGF